MDTKDQLRRTLIRHEGLRLKPYTDTVGKLTLGVGRNLTDVGITELEALFMLNNDIGLAQANLVLLFQFYDKLDQVRKDVLTMMAFQLGINGLLKFKKFLIAVEAKNFNQASVEMLQSQWNQQTPARCQELSQMMLSGTYRGN